MSRCVSDLGKTLFTLTLSRQACIWSKRRGIRSKPSDQVCIMTAGAPRQGKHTTAMHPEQNFGPSHGFEAKMATDERAQFHHWFVHTEITIFAGNTRIARIVSENLRMKTWKWKLGVKTCSENLWMKTCSENLCRSLFVKTLKWKPEWKPEWKP